MQTRNRHQERHMIERIGWLRAAVLGANDGIVSTASLIIGVATASVTTDNIVIAGAAGLAAGAMSMAAGEYVSVSSQSDAEKADLEREKAELKADPDGEHAELTAIYVSRGLNIETANLVATQLMEKDALEAHARDELAITSLTTAKPVTAAIASAIAFALGAAAPLALVFMSPPEQLIPVVATGSLASLAILGALGAKAGNASLAKPVLRVTFWGALAMAMTAGIGRVVGAVI